MTIDPKYLTQQERDDLGIDEYGRRIHPDGELKDSVVRKDVSELKQAFNKFLDQFEDGGQASSERVAKQILDGGLAKPYYDLETLRQENERLRQALEKITFGGDVYGQHEWRVDDEATRQIVEFLSGEIKRMAATARAALTGGEG